MAQFTQLDAGQLARIAVDFALGAVHSVRPLWAGTINSNFRIETEGGAIFLRVNEGKSEDDVAYEAELLSWLGDRGVRTPKPLLARSGRGYGSIDCHWVTLFPWVGGAHRDPPNARDCRALGTALAGLHRAGAGFPMRRTSRYGYAPIVARLAAVRSSSGGLLNAVSAEVRAALLELDAELARFGRDLAADGVIHGDLFPDNVLFANDAAGPCLLDFEQASDGNFAYDVAVAILSWCWHEPDRSFDSERVEALIAGYGPLDPVALESAARFAAARFTLTRITDVELNPRASAEIRAVKDYRQFLARLRVVQNDGLRAVGRGVRR